MAAQGTVTAVAGMATAPVLDTVAHDPATAVRGLATQAAVAPADMQAVAHTMVAAAVDSTAVAEAATVVAVVTGNR